MRVLVACEESQAVCTEFRRLGHEAYSCDVQPCNGGHPEWHIQGDALQLLNMKWDLIIAHPPCTYLSAAGAQRLFKVAGGEPDPARFEKGKEAARFFMAFWECDCPRVVVENPVPMKVFGLPKYTQIIHPYMFGDAWYKRTCLWIRGVEKLKPTKVVEPKGYWVQNSGKGHRGEYTGHRSQKMRSKTFPGIAKAMAEQWGGRN